MFKSYESNLEIEAVVADITIERLKGIISNCSHKFTFILEDYFSPIVDP